MRLLSSILVAALALPVYAYFPQWVRTDLRQVGPLNAVFSGEFSGDGRPDLVTHTAGHTITLHITQANSTFANGVVVHTATDLSDMLVADVNGDGRLDLVAADIGTNSIDVRLANGDGTFAAAVTNALAFSPTAIDSGDFDSDGTIDVVVRSSSATIFAVLTGDGAGHFAEAWRADADPTAVSLVAGDIDGDGHRDFLTRVADPQRYALYFGRGDATFDAIVHVPISATVPLRVVLADLDEDGDSEILTTNVPSAVHVIVNLGSRTFGAGDTYLVGGATSDAVDLLVTDVTDDGDADVVVSLRNSKRIGTLRGNGNGTLRAPDYSTAPSVTPFTSFFPFVLVAADFTGDGRVDLALDGSVYLAMFENKAGDVVNTLTSTYPTVSVGQAAKYQVQMSLAPGFIPPFGLPAPFMTGTVTMKDGDASITTGSLQNNAATFEVSSLEAGTHTITAQFNGDDNYRATASASVTQHVVNEHTTITLSRDGGNTEPSPYGYPLTIRGSVTSPLPGSLDGYSSIYVNGELFPYPYWQPPGPDPVWSITPDHVGTYEIYAKFQGTATQPPSTSEVLRVDIKKALSTTKIYNSVANHLLRYGDQPELKFHVDSAVVNHADDPEGNVQLYDGSTLLDTQPIGAFSEVVFTLPVLSPGVHYLHARYAGSENFEPSESQRERFTVFASGSFGLDAYAARVGNTIVIGAEAKYPAPPLGMYYRIYRRVGTNTWTIWNMQTFVPAVKEVNPQTNTVYAYRMEAYDQSNNLVAISNSDVAVLFDSTDQPLTNATRIKAIHVQEIVAAINVLRAAASLSPISLSGTGAGEAIRLTHLTQLRQAINDARNALGVQSVDFSSGASAGSPVLGKHFQELRDAMQ